jgi:quinohemoprotein ethanol dehydrogenase
MTLTEVAVAQTGTGVASGGSAVQPSAEWSILGGGPEQQFFSPLTQISTGNVQQLGLKWHVDIPTADGLISNPLVAEGYAYVIGAYSKVWAVDIAQGKIAWAFDPKVRVRSAFASMWSHHLNRGVALWKDSVIFGTSDCRLVSVDRRTGTLKWVHQVCEDDGTRAINGAPRIGGDKVFIGNSDVDTGVGRGSMDAYDAATGKRLWRFYTLPGDPTKPENQTRANAIALASWPDDGWKKAGGGSTWEGITYDPVLQRVYFGVDGPSPWNAATRRGDNLFTESIVAVDANTGEYIWHYQATPNDTWDFNDCSPIVITELPVNGVPTRVLLHSPKNGFFYVLEASSGKLLSADKIGNPTWASSIDLKTGRPVENPAARYYATHERRAMVNPGPIGAHNWHAMSYSPRQHLVYVPMTDVAVLYGMLDSAAALGGDTLMDYYAGMDADKKEMQGSLVAWDPVARKRRWSVPLVTPTNGGVLSTAGGLVFQGTGTGEFAAYDAESGSKKWSFSTGSAIQAAPSTVEQSGTQLVLVAVGDGGGIGLSTPRYSSTLNARGPARLLGFALGGREKLNTDMPPIRFEMPPRPKPSSAAQVQRGKDLYSANSCDYCHGPRVERWTMSVPDLRRSTAQTHNDFLSIVIGGARAEKGMPQFSQLMPQDAEDLRAYVLDRAWAAYDAQKSRAPQSVSN